MKKKEEFSLFLIPPKVGHLFLISLQDKHIKEQMLEDIRVT